MPNTREKLIELLYEAEEKCEYADCGQCEYLGRESCGFHLICDHLIANGVTVQEWIPVSERSPQNIGLYLVIEKHWLDGSPCRRIAKWNTVEWFTADRKSKEITPRVTHWMPLPEPPKGADQ